MLFISKRKNRMVVGVSSVQQDKPPTWEEIGQDIDSLIGMETVKEQLLQIARALENIQFHRERHRLRQTPSLHFLIQGPIGCGKKQVAMIISKLLQYYQLAEKPLHFVTPRGIEGLSDITESSTIYVPVVDRLIPNEKRPDNSMVSIFWFHLERLAEQHNVILAVDSDPGKRFLETLGLAAEIMVRIHIPDYRWSDFLAFARSYAGRHKFRLTKAAVEQFRSCLEEQQKEPGFSNMLAVKKLIDRAMMNYYMDPSEDAPKGRQYAALQPQHFGVRSKPKQKAETKRAVPPTQDPFTQLDSLIGLQEVKTRLKQLMALVSLQKRRREQGLPVEPITTHMSFSGSPGTGKTTVARLVGQALKELGFLEKGHFVEASREDLVGQYVGHTAQKTAEIVERALGGVLFIDECYSLNAGHNTDYGREAVATLIKKMEDSRHNLTVIIGGYGSEMEQFFQMNPGLRSRVQFHISFPDYSAEELMEIFLKLCRDGGYDLAPEAEKELEILLNQLSEHKQENFANGRLVRSLFERAKLSLAERAWKEPETTSLTLLLPEDIKTLTSYDDINRLLQAQRRIGFQAVSA